MWRRDLRNWAPGEQLAGGDYVQQFEATDAH